MDVRLRYAEYEDCERLYRWRIDGETNDWYDGRKVEWESHKRWFYDRMEPTALVTIWIAELETAYGWIPVGSCREDSNGELSYHVALEWQRKGLGSEIVRQAVERSKQHRLKACVDHDNRGGAKVVIKAGFELRPDVDFYLLRR